MDRASGGCGDSRLPCKARSNGVNEGNHTEVYLRLIQSSCHYLVVMTSKKLPNGKMEGIAHPITAKGRRMIEGAVMAEYRKATAGSY
jgi:hypothetical protein